MLALGLVALFAVSAAGGTAAWMMLTPRVHGVSQAAVADVLAVRLASAAGGSDWHSALPQVYSARDGQPLWMDLDARDAALGELRDAHFDGTLSDSASLAGLYDRANAPTASDSSLAELDLDITNALLGLGDSLTTAGPDANEMYGNLWFPFKRTHPDAAMALLGALSTSPDTGEAAPLAEAVRTWAASLRPHADGYMQLRRALLREASARASATPPFETDLAVGDTGRAVVALRMRLKMEGFASAGDREATFDDSLSVSLAGYQAQLGLDPSGRVGPATRRALNKRQPELIPLMRLNLARWQWLPDSLGTLHVFVNIPEFELTVVDGDSAGAPHEVLRSNVVVGTRGWETPVMTDTMEFLVFNPTWTIPASIQKESYGRVDPRGMVRDPGPSNPLGRVKFMFPNDHAIYIHDTPSKWAFGEPRRAYSHGCVRAGDPRDLAAALLTRVNGWKREQIDEIFEGPWRLQQEDLDGPVPVHLVYMTAVADRAGRVRVFDDVYGHDKKLAVALGILLPEIEKPEEANA